MKPQAKTLLQLKIIKMAYYTQIFNGIAGFSFLSWFFSTHSMQHKYN